MVDLDKSNKVTKKNHIFASMKKKRTFQLAVLGVLLLLALGIWAGVRIKERLEVKRWLNAGPIENHPVRVFDVKYPREFNDLNETQLVVAQAIGVPPVADREAAELLKGKLVEIQSGEYYKVDSLTHSIPYLIPQAADLLERIGRDFLDSLSAKGLNPNKIVVTSILRTEADVKKLRKGNINASDQSTHRFGTTFDLSYWRFEKVPDLRGRPYEDVPPEQLRAVLGQVLKALHDQGTCYIKYERKQNCFHITVRK
jgi:hypothetical protein